MEWENKLKSVNLNNPKWTMSIPHWTSSSVSSRPFLLLAQSICVPVSAPSPWTMASGGSSTVPTTSMELKSFSPAILGTIELAPPTFSAWLMGRGAGGTRDPAVEVRNLSWVLSINTKIFNEGKDKEYWCIVLKTQQLYIFPDITNPLPEVFSWLLLPLGWRGKLLS